MENTQVQEQATPQTPVEPPQVEMVSKAELEKVLSDMHKFKAQVKEQQVMLERANVEKLKATSDWKAVAEVKEQEADTAKREAEQLKAAFVNTQKLGSVREAALKAGLIASAVDDLDLLEYPEISVETTSTGRFNVLGADKAVQRLRTIRPHWFKSNVPNVNAISPDVTSPGKITWEQIQKLEAEAKKSGNYAPYRDALLKFKAQS